MDGDNKKKYIDVNEHILLNKSEWRRIIYVLDLE